MQRPRRSDPSAVGLDRCRAGEGFVYLDCSGSRIPDGVIVIGMHLVGITIRSALGVTKKASKGILVSHAAVEQV
ncbi:MAG: hypothetical protein ACRDZ5_10125, partial [Acidimicrobiales bacterium]